MAKELQIQYIGIKDVKPYEKNPRNNKDAIQAVKKSIEDFGFLIPCVVDQDNVLVAGHTRYAAAKLLKMKKIPCVQVSNLTPEQVNTFRIIDNKTAELASWDMDLLAEEIHALSESGLDFTPYGFTKEEIDCLSEFVSGDCLDITEDDLGVNAPHKKQRDSHISADSKSVKVAVGEINFFVDTTVS